MMRRVIGERLKKAREASDLDQVDMAVGLGFRWQAAVSNIECGRSSIGDDPTPAAEPSRLLSEAIGRPPRRV